MIILIMYETVSVGITESQLQTLLAGQKIFLEKSQFHGDVPLPLTKAQATLLATATRGVNLKLSSRQIKLMQSGEGWLGDRLKQAGNAIKAGAKAAGKALVPLGRKGVDMGLDLLQAKIPTQQLGPLKFLGDKAVGAGRSQVNKLADRLQKMLGGAAGVAAINAQIGEGWFSDYLLPSVSTAAKIATPFIGRGVGSQRHLYEPAIDEQMGEGWFSDYLLPGVETAAKIATPFMGKGFLSSLFGGSMQGLRKPIGVRRITGEGFFDSFLSPVMQIAAPFVAKAMGGRGWTPMAEMKKNSGQGLVL